MKRTIFVLWICALLLCGCGPNTLARDATAPPEETASTTPVISGYYDRESAIEQSTDGAVRCYPLIGLDCTGVMPLKENILAFSCTENTTTLTLLSGENLYPTASMALDFMLTPSSSSLRSFPGGFSFYDEATRETVLVDETLQQLRRISAPEDLMGVPLLSTDCCTLYYCTADSVRALDLEAQISRCLRETSYPFQCLEGLWIDDAVLECYTSTETGSQTLFLSTETGQLLGSAGNDLTFSASAERYYAAKWSEPVNQYLFGSLDSSTQVLNPAGDIWDLNFVPDSHGAVALSMTDSGQISLEFYDFRTGFRTSRISIATEYFPWDYFTAIDGRIGFLNYDPEYGCNVLYLWDTSMTLTGDDTIYTDTYYTRESPDHQELAECALYAQQIGEKYGIEILIYKDAAAVQPWDYDLEYEHLPGVLNRELELLDEHLSNYPDGFLAALAGRYNGLKICIVRSLTGSAESGSLDSADGIQFMENYTAYVALAAPMNTEYALYHELCHLIDTVVLTESGAYDRWEELNPSGFAYDYDYVANATRNSSAYLQDSSRYFIDNYSMSYPKEDRARIMEYAMTEGNESYFQSPTMQAKLKLLCEGIREAFDLEKSPETFLWEQYLNVSLAYNK